MFLKIIPAIGIFTLMGCSASKPDSEHYSGFLKDYSHLQEKKSATGKIAMVWIDKNFNPDNYDNIVYNPVVYSPSTQTATKIPQALLTQMLGYTNQSLQTAIAKQKPIASMAGQRSLIFRGAITHIESSTQGLQVYEILPVGLAIVGAQVATGHRTMNTSLLFEGEIRDAGTNKPVIRVVRQGDGEDLPNKSTPITIATFKEAIDDIVADTVSMVIN